MQTGDFWADADLSRTLADLDRMSETWMKAGLMQQLIQEAQRRLVWYGYQIEPSDDTWHVTRGPQTIPMNDRQLVRCAVAVQQTQAQLDHTLAALGQPPGHAADVSPASATTQRSCSWCDTLNGMDVRFCRSCGHEAQRPRMLCHCQACQRRLAS